jgi:hypothetical protein
MVIKMSYVTIDCPDCHDALQSHYKHEKRTCGCGQITVEGGNPIFEYKQPLEGFKVVQKSKHEATILEPYWFGRINYVKFPLTAHNPQRNKPKQIQTKQTRTKIKAKIE